jgi:cell division protein FtsW
MNLDRTKRQFLINWWWTLDRYILTGILLLVALGIALIMAASPYIAQRIGLDSFYFLKRQIVYIILGFGIIIFLSLSEPVFIRRISVLGFLGCLTLLILIEFMGYETKGARRWIYLAGFSIQPSEIIKPFFVVLVSWFITRKNLETGFPGFTIATILFAIIAALLVRQPDFGMTLTLGAIWFTLMVMGGLSVVFIIIMMILGILGIAGGYMFLPHVQKRIDTFLSGGTSQNYQTQKSLEAFNNGGIFGTGPGQGKVKEILPDAHTDFIFSVAGEEFGLLFCLLIISLYCAVIFRCLYRVYLEKDLFIILSLTGLCMQIFFQAAVNMGVTINLLPNTGMTLPFISYGGSSMISVSIAAGIMLSFTRKRFGK